MMMRSLSEIVAILKGEGDLTPDEDGLIEAGGGLFLPVRKKRTPDEKQEEIQKLKEELLRERAESAALRERLGGTSNL